MVDGPSLFHSLFIQKGDDGLVCMHVLEGN